MVCVMLHIFVWVAFTVTGCHSAQPACIIWQWCKQQCGYMDTRARLSGHSTDRTATTAQQCERV